MTYNIILYLTTADLEFKDLIITFTIIDIVVCGLYFVLSLSALLNLFQPIRHNFFLSLLTFIGLPVCLFLYFLIGFIIDFKGTETLIGLLLIELPSLTFCPQIIYHFYQFRKTINTDKAIEEKFNQGDFYSA